MVEHLLKTRDVAALLGVEMGTVYDYWEAKLLPGFRLGGRERGPLRFRSDEIEAVLESWRGGTLPPVHMNGPAHLQVPGPGTGGKAPYAPRTLRPVNGR
jgi:predicted DNA-binding transcriptional regulator AlpA